MNEDELMNANETRRLVDLGAGAMRPEQIDLRKCSLNPETLYAIWRRGDEEERDQIVGYVVFDAGAVTVCGPFHGEGAATFGSWKTKGLDPIPPDEYAEHFAAARDAIADFYSRKAAGLA